MFERPPTSPRTDTLVPCAAVVRAPRSALEGDAGRRPLHLTAVNQRHQPIGGFHMGFRGQPLAAAEPLPAPTVAPQKPRHCQVMNTAPPTTIRHKSVLLRFQDTRGTPAYEIGRAHV